MNEKLFVIGCVYACACACVFMTEIREKYEHECSMILEKRIILVRIIIRMRHVGLSLQLKKNGMPVMRRTVE